MDEIQYLLKIVKRELRLRGLSYRDVALALELSEPSVKRLFSNGRFTLDRLAQLAQLLDLTLAELMQEIDRSKPQVRQLTAEQEAGLVSDPKLLLVAVCTLNHWPVSDMIRFYRISEAECIHALLRLDRMRLIDLLPGNRVRIVVTRDFDWLADGPIRRYFREQGQDDFLSNAFADGHACHSFANGMLTDAAAEELQRLLQRLRQQFEQLHQESLSQPLDKRYGTGLLLATRRWEPPGFTALRRS